MAKTKKKADLKYNPIPGMMMPFDDGDTDSDLEDVNEIEEAKQNLQADLDSDDDSVEVFR